VKQFTCFLRNEFAQTGGSMGGRASVSTDRLKVCLLGPMDEKLLRKLTAGAQKVLENAASLYKEALTLMEAGALSRALFLHQISMEECAEVESWERMPPLC